MNFYQRIDPRDIPARTEPLDSKTLTEARFKRTEDSTARLIGHGATVGSQAVAQRFFTNAEAAIKAHAAKPSAFKHLPPSFKLITHDKLALIGVQGILNAVGDDMDHSATLRHLGILCEVEARAAHLIDQDARRFKRALTKIKKKHPSMLARAKQVRSMPQFTNEPIEPWTPWTQRERVRAGHFIVEAMRGATGIFTLVDRELPKFGAKPTDIHIQHFMLTPEAKSVAEAMVAEATARYPVRLPGAMIEPWVAARQDVGGYQATLVKSHAPGAVKAVQAAIDDGSMSGCLDALNVLQAVPYRVNEFILETVAECYNRGIKVGDKRGGLVPKADKSIVDVRKAADVRKLNQSYRGQRVTLFLDLAIARQLSGAPFFTPYHYDYRGRLVPLTSFNFQRQDHVRAMFQFDRGEVLNADGLYWLRAHLASCGDFDRVSKKPFKARVQWTVDNHDDVLRYATSPFEDLTWTEADKPFAFLAACAAYRDALDGLPVHLPVAFDGSCSGLQHLCSMTRDEAGALVNLMPSTEPMDIYATVARAVEKLVRADTGNPMAGLWVHEGITRKTVKQQVMTLAYGVSGNGMTDQSMNNTMAELNEQALDGTPNPFSMPMTTNKGVHIEDDGGFQASVYMTKMILQAVKGVVGRPMEAMEFLKAIARAAADDNRSMRWTTPLGFPVNLHYAKVSEERIKLTGAEGGVYTPMVREFTNEIDSKGAVDAAAPSFVHSLDGCHLQMVANACAAEGIELGTVHDSFGCHPNHAPRLRSLLVQEFHALYQNDVLGNVRDAALEQDISGKTTVPLVPGRGELDLDRVIEATFAFS